LPKIANELLLKCMQQKINRIFFNLMIRLKAKVVISAFNQIINYELRVALTGYEFPPFHNNYKTVPVQ
jgi:hypothetical protein